MLQSRSVALDSDHSLASAPSDEVVDQSGVIQPFHSFILSLVMILFSEVGDKTFLVAVLMAMRHARFTVFSAALSALVTMTVLSAVLGQAVPFVLDKRFTFFLAAILFLAFGAKMVREGIGMNPDEGVSHEMKEVEMELEEIEEQDNDAPKRRRSSSIVPRLLESGRIRDPLSAAHGRTDARSSSSSSSGVLVTALLGLKNMFSLLVTPPWIQTFLMTFVGEWGDRSQIATIAMATGQDYWWVTSGAIIGHAICTATAVLGGRALAGRVSIRIVTLGGAVTFIIFGFIYLAEAVYTK